ncbi:winged helix DNA-binding domain-containing protein [Mycolicibacterium phlei]
MRRFTIDERRARLARRHFLSAPGASIDEVVGAVVGLHTTDPATPYLSLWSRLSGFTVADLDAEVYERRSLVRQLAMRRTLWTVRVPDLPAVQVAASSRVADTERRRLIADAQKAGVCRDGDAWLEAARSAVLDYLAANEPSDARTLRAALPELAGTWDPAPGKRWGGETPLAPRILTVLAAQGDIVRGPNDGRWTTSRPRWVAAGSWIDPGSAVDAESARAELLHRWLAAFGPATVADVKWWFGHTLTWAREGLRDIEAVEVDLDGTTGFVLPEDLDEEPPVQRWCALLPGLDVTTMGWFDRDWYLGPHRDQVFDRNGNAGPTVWCDGRVVGGWRQDEDGRVELLLLEDVGRAADKELRKRAAELTEWLDGVRVSPRFPSPLTRS